MIDLVDAGDRVGRLLRLAIELAQRADDADIGERLQRELAALQTGSDRPATVVVVGETNAGKSSLVNAMLQAPGLSPVDRRVATNAYIAFRWADAPQAEIRLQSGERRAIALDEIAAFATEGGNRNNALGVSSVEVGLPSETLRELTIIDSPGVGGLEARHVEIAMLAVGLADALLFVVDAEREISAPALRFLERAAERVDTVLIAVTKKDRYPAAAEILAADRRLLGEHAPRFAQAPIELVSSRDAEDSLGEADPDYAGELRRAANIERVVELLRAQVAGRAGELRLLNATAVAASAVHELESAFEGRLHAAQAGPEYGRALTDRRDALTRRRDDAAYLSQQLLLRLQEFQSQRQQELGDRLSDLQMSFGDRTDEIARAGEDAIEPFLGELTEQLMRAALALNLATAEGLPGLIASVIGDTELGLGLTETLTTMAQRRTEVVAHMPKVNAPGWTLSELAGTIVTMGAGRTVIMLIPGTAAGITTLPLTLGVIGVGSAYALLMRRERGRQATRAALTSAIAQTVSRARTQITAEYGQMIIALRAELEPAVRQEIARRVRAIDAEIRENGEASRRSEQERQASAKHLQEGIVLCRSLLERNAQPLLAQLRPRADGTGA